MMGMSEQDERDRIRAGIHRVAAQLHRRQADRHDMAAAVIPAGSALRRLAALVATGDAMDVATHPDLAELDLQLDGYYRD
jgi:hypothetical protein